MWILFKPLNFRMDFFFGAETSSFVSFTALENVTIEKELKYQ